MFGFVCPLYFRYRVIAAIQLVLYAIGFAIKEVGCTNEHIVGNVIQMPTVFKPWAGHRDMVGGAFTFCFNQEFQAFNVYSFPCCKWVEQLQTLRICRYKYFYIAAIFSRFLEAAILHIKSFWRKFYTARFRQFYFFSFVVGKSIG